MQETIDEFNKSYFETMSESPDIRLSPEKIVDKLSPMLLEGIREFYLPKSGEKFDNLAKFVKQNTRTYLRKLKIIVLGSDSVGKTTFVNNFCMEIDSKKPSGLRIRKILDQIDDIPVAIEFIDTNVDVQKKNLLETYMKVSDGIVIIINPFDSLSCLHALDVAKRAVRTNNEFFVLSNTKSEEEEETNINARGIMKNISILEELSELLQTKIIFSSAKRGRSIEMVSFMRNLLKRK